MRENQNREVKKWEGVSKTEKREELNWTGLMFSVLPKLEKPEGWFFKLNLTSTNCSLYSPVSVAKERAEECRAEGRTGTSTVSAGKKCYLYVYDFSSPFHS